MPISLADKRATFRKLHDSGCFVIPNPFDVGSAKALAQMGFKALASTSAGFAWTIGKADNRVTVDDVCAHLTALCAAVDLPVNADFENGFADDPDEVGDNVAMAIETGIAGLSIEDSTRDLQNPLYDIDVAAERIRAARHANPLQPKAHLPVVGVHQFPQQRSQDLGIFSALLVLGLLTAGASGVHARSSRS